MPSYSFRVRDRSGKPIEGILEADTRQTVLNRLREQNYLIIKVEEKNPPLVNLGKLNLLTFEKVKTKDLALFSRQFATMIDAGVPLLRSLNILEQQVENKLLQKAIGQIAGDLEKGDTLSEAMGKHPKVFPVMYTNMVGAGEVGGVLEQVLERMAVHFEKEDEIKEKVKSAMTYPAVIICVALLAIIFMLVFVLPSFSNMLADLGVEMPAMTQFLLNLSESMRTRWYLYIVSVAGAVALIVSFFKNPRGRYLWDKYSLRLPIYGNMQTKVLISSLSRTLATLLRSGVPIVTSLEVAKKTSSNSVMAESLEKAKGSIRDGLGISEPLKSSGILPPMALHMIAIGEETGELDSLLEKISYFYDREVEHTVSRLSAALEPMLLVGVGLVIGGMVLSIMLPMVQVYGSF